MGIAAVPAKIDTHPAPEDALFQQIFLLPGEGIGCRVLADVLQAEGNIRDLFLRHLRGSVMSGFIAGFKIRVNVNAVDGFASGSHDMLIQMGEFRPVVRNLDHRACHIRVIHIYLIGSVHREAAKQGCDCQDKRQNAYN